MAQAEEATAEMTSMICPRCGAEVIEIRYGPCSDCRVDLAAKFGGRQGGDVAVEETERIHRTPNFVATKD